MVYKGYMIGEEVNYAGLFEAWHLDNDEEPIVYGSTIEDVKSEVDYRVFKDGEDDWFYCSVCKKYKEVSKLANDGVNPEEETCVTCDRDMREEEAE